MAGWIQNPLPPYNLVPRDEYVRPKEAQHFVIDDMKEFISPVDRTLVSGRKSYEAHNKRNNVVSAADITPETASQMQKERNKPPSRKEVQARREQISEAIDHMQRTGQRPRVETADYDYKDMGS